MPFNLVLIGPPGVGKGTQAALLTGRLGLVHLSSGDVFRSEIAAGSAIGARAKSYMDKGELVPDDVTVEMMESRFTTEQAKTSGFVLDGFPRTLGQARALDRKLSDVGVEIARVVSLEASDDVVVLRLSGRRLCPNCGAIYHLKTKPPAIEAVCDNCGASLRQRSDDKEETVRQRLVVFHGQTQPVLDYYAGTGKLIRVSADGSAEQVYARVLEGLGV